MSDWDDDSAQLRSNLLRVLLDVREHALQRATQTVEAARKWQSGMMHQLTPPEPRYVGRFRGEAGLEGCEVAVGNRRGVASDRVEDELKAFEAKLQSAVQALDELIKPQQDMSADELAAIVDLCAWAHSEWVRIHPFANGNGRTARLWANNIAMRYGLPPFVRLRPRPMMDTLPLVLRRWSVDGNQRRRSSDRCTARLSASDCAGHGEPGRTFTMSERWRHLAQGAAVVVSDPLLW